MKKAPGGREQGMAAAEGLGLGTRGETYMWKLCCCFPVSAAVSAVGTMQF